MTEPAWVDRDDDLPIDPDVEAVEDARHHPTAPDSDVGRTPWPRLNPKVIAAVFAGGCVGGGVRYGVSEAWPASTQVFPWATFTVNVAGAFILPLVIVVAADVLARPRYLRPLLGTGFCGALTTFSSVVVTVDELTAHGHAQLAAGYLTATIAAGLAAAALGLLVGRSFAAWRNGLAREGAR